MSFSSVPGWGWLSFMDLPLDGMMSETSELILMIIISQLTDRGKTRPAEPA